MRPAIPDAKRIADAFAPENAGEPFVLVTEGIVVPSRDNNIHPAQRRQPVRVVLALQEDYWLVEVHRLVVEAIREAPDVVEAAQTDHPADQVWVAEGEVGRVVGAERGAG